MVHSRVGLLVLVLALGCGFLAACGSSDDAGSESQTQAQPKEKSGFKIAYSAWSTNDPYSSGILAGLKQTAAKLGDKVVLVTNANNDAEKQGHDVSDIVAIKPDAVVLAPIDIAQSKAWVKRLTAANIKVFTMLLAVDHYGLPLYEGVSGAVQYDEAAGAAENAKILAQHLKPPAKVAVLMGQPGNLQADLRYKGFSEELEKHGDYTVIKSAPGQYTPANGLATCQSLIASNPGLKAIFSESDVETTGCIRAPNIGKTYVLSTGGSPPDQESIKDGKVLGTSCYLPEPFAQAGMEDLHKVLTGERKEGLLRNFVPTGVTKETIASCPRK